MTIDEVNERLRLGLCSVADAEAYCKEWNETAGRFHHAEVFGGRILLLPVD